MRQYLVRRLLQVIPILLGVSIILFVIVHSTPGNPYAYLFGPKVDPTLRAKLIQQQGFNDPLPMQYVRWLKTTLSGNLGYSLRTREPVVVQLSQALPRTLLLTGTAFVMAIIVAIPIGVISATRQYSFTDYFVTTFSFAGISLPSFFAALLAVYLFAVKWRLFPTNGMVEAGAAVTAGTVIYHLVLPAVTLGLRDMAGYSRFTRSSMLEVLRQDYVRTARSKGLSERTVVYKHALRNSLIPVVTLFGFSVAGLFGGAIIIETIFAWPGMGMLGLTAVNNRDYPMLMAVNLLGAILVIFGNLLADVLYAVVDPRIRYS